MQKRAENSLNRTRIRSLDGALLAIALGAAIACSSSVNNPCASPKTMADQQICDNCRTNLETAGADFNFCASGSAPCEPLKGDLTQLGKVNASAKASADAAIAHVDDCAGKGKASAECSAVEKNIAAIHCE